MTEPKPAKAPPLTEADVEAQRLACRTLLDTEPGLTAARLARELGLKEGTFGPWLSGTYAGRNDRIAITVRNGLAARARGQATRAIVQNEVLFVDTPTAQTFLDLFSQAQHLPDMAVVVGAPGVGKSTAACHYTATNPNVFKIVCRPSLSGPKAVLDDLARVLQLMERSQLHRVSLAVMNRLRGRAALLIIDEAQHLTKEALDELRALHDQGIGIVLLGNESILGQMDQGGPHAARFAQLTSRIGMRITRKRARAGDIDALLDAWGIEEEAVRRALTGRAMRPGTLRAMQKCWRLAQMLAAAEGVEPGAKHVEMADRRLPGAAPAGEAAA
jgi:DNA transposition AAA+ family ATPase